ncbi:outer membrane lipoprotein carrier protein LolA [Enhygromyxa salina]|uniref:Outer membrane lipoprotein carrier protein LolA n=1 Tax=Enhygromyxa salina TaxID=215803 RepID=A0A2S9YQV7_9BACT|nr:outer membrane lipoprotein carrier protein LolA [Enhygromyxa salina]PRQ07484.1 Outer membrane lipoprotein carrier protein LolA [Enhygromyxa salina]
MIVRSNSGSGIVRRLVLCAALPWLAGGAAGLTTGLVAPVAEAAAPVSVDELLVGFAQMPGLYAEFRQESHFGLLAEPLIDTGTLHFANGRLARRTLAPTPSVVIMDAKGIEYGDASKTERIELDGKPAVRQFVDAFTKIFAGDRSGLEALYRIEFQAGEDRSWTMTLVPKVSPMDKIIAKVVVSGTNLEIGSMRVVERGGDETITVFSKVDTQRKYAAAELARLFSVAGS